MLILSRRAEESIMIGEDIKMTILSVKGRQVRVGFEAPKELPIHRMEVFERIQAGDPIEAKPEALEKAS